MVSGDESIGENEKLASVSTVLGIVNKPGLVNWAVGLAKQGVDHIEERDKAAELGTSLHKAIQSYLEEEIISPAGLGMITLGQLTRWIEWYKDSGITITATEKMVYHPVFKYAGTLDALGRDNDGKLVVLDWKSGGLWPEMALQLAAYGKALQLHGMEVSPSDVPQVRGVLVGLKEQPVEVKEVDDMDKAFGMFQSTLNLYKNLKDTKAVSVWRK